ncbi:basic salivary proline-rich protein 4-like [Fundulus heteroclitus]|uniref:basic salivary proline-rich protein 4-like n=1 Tax=Fundulus heteroclitus TaxID=8078 RepID=UPI00165B0238|nr:basic salivary proline-rich protein 4-like [Fundulus heteroclitus]
MPCSPGLGRDSREAPIAGGAGEEMRKRRNARPRRTTNPPAPHPSRAETYGNGRASALRGPERSPLPTPTPTNVRGQTERVKDPPAWPRARPTGSTGRRGNRGGNEEKTKRPPAQHDRPARPAPPPSRGVRKRTGQRTTRTGTLAPPHSNPDRRPGLVRLRVRRRESKTPPPGPGRDPRGAPGAGGTGEEMRKRRNARTRSTTNPPGPHTPRAEVYGNGRASAPRGPERSPLPTPTPTDVRVSARPTGGTGRRGNRGGNEEKTKRPHAQHDRPARPAPPPSRGVRKRTGQRATRTGTLAPPHSYPDRLLSQLLGASRGHPPGARANGSRTGAAAGEIREKGPARVQSRRRRPPTASPPPARLPRGVGHRPASDPRPPTQRVRRGRGRTHGTGRAPRFRRRRGEGDGAAAPPAAARAQPRFAPQPDRPSP